MLLRDGYFAIHPDLTLQAEQAVYACQIAAADPADLRKEKMDAGAADRHDESRASTASSFLKSGKTERQLTVRPDVFLFRQFGGAMYPVQEAALVGGEDSAISNSTEPVPSIISRSSRPNSRPLRRICRRSRIGHKTAIGFGSSVAPFAIRSRHRHALRRQRKTVGYSRRPVELEIIGSNGVKTLKGGKIRSALRLAEQLFVMNKRYSGQSGRRATHSPAAAGATASACANTVPSASPKWASNTTRSSSTITPASI